jgi:acetyl esterase/lipase
MDANASWEWGIPLDFALWAEAYAGGAPYSTPLLAPGRADLSRLPPLHFLWGSREMLRDQVVDCVTRAKDAGIEVHAEEYPDMVHNWMVLHGLTPEAERAYQAMGRFIRRVTR